MALLDNTQTADELVAKVEPVLRRYAAAGEAERQLAPEAMDALIEAGLFQTWVPKALGGLELDPLPALRMFEELSRIDASAGWIVGNASQFAAVCQVLPDEGAAEIFSDPRTLIAGAWNPPGAARPVAGGYRVAGRWPFSSACRYGNWLAGLCLVMDDGTPRVGPDGNPTLLVVFFEATAAEIFDTWHTLGMRGTGSNDIQVNDLFVPERRTYLMAPWDHPGSAFTGPLYRINAIWTAGPQIGVTALGIARAALDELIELAAGKTPSYTQTGLADRPVVQDRVARARAVIDAARSYIYAAVGDAWEFVQGGQRITVNEGMPLALAGAFGGEAAVQAVAMVHSMAGTSAIRNERRLQQHFRDVNTLSQHAFNSPNRFESVGKILLGRDSDWGFYYV